MNIADANAIEEIAKLTMEKRVILLELKERYEKEVAELPKGTVSVRPQRGKEFFYHIYYCDIAKKGITRYIPKAKGIIMQKQVARRKELEEYLKNIWKDLEAIGKILKIANKRTQEINGQESIIGKLKEVSNDTKNNTNMPKQVPDSNIMNTHVKPEQ